MKITTIDSEQIKFDNGTTITQYHSQDCCEEVYADFEQLEDTGIMNREFDSIEIVGVEDHGFLLNKFFVPCYDNQNGYYNSSLELEISYPGGKKEKIDLSTFTEENIS